MQQDKDAEIEALKAVIAAKDAEIMAVIADKDAMIAAKDTEIMVVIADKDAVIAVKDAVIAAKDT